MAQVLEGPNNNGRLTKDEQMEQEIYNTGGCISGHIGELVFARRLNIVKKFWAFYLRMDMKINNAHREVYAHYPPWGFYTDASDECLIRPATGLKALPNKQWAMPCLKLVTKTGNIETAEIPVVELIQHEKWPREIVNVVTKWKCSGIFIDPMGYLTVTEIYHGVVGTGEIGKAKKKK